MAKVLVVYDHDYDSKSKVSVRIELFFDVEYSDSCSFYRCFYPCPSLYSFPFVVQPQVLNIQCMAIESFPP